MLESHVNLLQQAINDAVYKAYRQGFEEGHLATFAADDAERDKLTFTQHRDAVAKGRWAVVQSRVVHDLRQFF